MSNERGETALLIPVPEAEPLILPWQRTYDPASATGVPSHITLIYPFLPPERLEPALIDDLRSIFTRSAPFSFVLNGFDRFPGVLFLTPEPSQPFVALIEALVARVPEAPPYGGAHETIIPHLTVVHHDDPKLLGQIAAALAPALPLPCTARQVWLLEQDDRDDWQTRHRFPLGG
jgi:2'-5' RNA ligase